jgi:hypothetical protein
MWGLMEGMRDLTRELAEVRPEQLVALMHIIRKFKESPDEVMERMEVVIVEPQNIVLHETGKEAAA